MHSLYKQKAARGGILTFKGDANSYESCRISIHYTEGVVWACMPGERGQERHSRIKQTVYAILQGESSQAMRFASISTINMYNLENARFGDLA